MGGWGEGGERGEGEGGGGEGGGGGGGGKAPWTWNWETWITLHCGISERIKAAAAGPKRD